MAFRGYEPVFALSLNGWALSLFAPEDRSVCCSLVLSLEADAQTYPLVPMADLGGEGSGIDAFWQELLSGRPIACPDGLDHGLPGQEVLAVFGLLSRRSAGDAMRYCPLLLLPLATASSPPGSPPRLVWGGDAILPNPFLAGEMPAADLSLIFGLTTHAGPGSWLAAMARRLAGRLDAGETELVQAAGLTLTDTAPLLVRADLAPARWSDSLQSGKKGEGREPCRVTRSDLASRIAAARDRRVLLLTDEAGLSACRQVLAAAGMDPADLLAPGAMVRDLAKELGLPWVDGLALPALLGLERFLREHDDLDGSDLASGLFEVTGAVALVEHMARQASAIEEERARLDRSFRTTALPSLIELERHRQILRDSKWLRRYSAPARQARRAYRDLCHRAGWHGRRRIRRGLETLIAWSQRAQDFKTSNRYRHLLGSEFKGTESDFEALRAIASLADTFRSSLPSGLPVAMPLIAALRSRSAAEISDLRQRLSALEAAFSRCLARDRPCLLATPAQLVRLLPPEPDLFDELVMDEAAGLTEIMARGGQRRLGSPA